MSKVKIRIKPHIAKPSNWSDPQSLVLTNQALLPEQDDLMPAAFEMADRHQREQYLLLNGASGEEAVHKHPLLLAISPDPRCCLFVIGRVPARTEGHSLRQSQLLMI